MFRRHAYWYTFCSRSTSECGQAPGQAQPGALPTRLPPSHPALHRHAHHRPILLPRAPALPAGQRLESNPHTQARGPLPPSRNAAPPLHPHLDPNQARVIVGRSIAIVGQLRRPSRSARAVAARAAASQPTEPLQPEPCRAARAGRRPSRHPSSSLRYAMIWVLAARAVAVPRAGTRGSRRPGPVPGRLSA